MKFNVEVDLEDLYPEDEETSLTDMFKGQIQYAVRDYLKPTVEPAIKEMREELIAFAKNEMSNRVGSAFSDIWDQPVTQTDSFGDEVATFPSVREMAKKRIMDYLGENVDAEKGTKPDSGYYRRKSIPRVEYMLKSISGDALDAQIKKMKTETDKKVKDAFEKMGKDIDARIESLVKDELGSRVGKLLEVEKLLLKK